MSTAITGPSDLRDQRWLDERVEAARGGIEAVIDIALNWTEGREVGRLHPGVAPADYVREHVGLVGREAIVPLLTASNWSNRQIAKVVGVSPQTVGRLASTVPNGTVRPPTEFLDNPPTCRTAGAYDRTDKTLGGDGKLRSLPRPRLDPAPDPFLARAVETVATPLVIELEVPIEPAPEWAVLVQVMDSIDALSSSDAAYLAATVPNRRRATTAKRLRKLGTYLGRIAWVLEGNEEVHDIPSA